MEVVWSGRWGCDVMCGDGGRVGVGGGVGVRGRMCVRIGVSGRREK